MLVTPEREMDQGISDYVADTNKAAAMLYLLQDIPVNPLDLEHRPGRHTSRLLQQARRQSRNHPQSWAAYQPVESGRFEEILDSEPSESEFSEDEEELTTSPREADSDSENPPSPPTPSHDDEYQEDFGFWKWVMSMRTTSSRVLHPDFGLEGFFSKNYQYSSVSCLFSFQSLTLRTIPGSLRRLRKPSRKIPRRNSSVAFKVELLMCHFIFNYVW